MIEKSFEKTEFEFPARKNYKGMSYELSELTPEGTALYIATKSPSMKEDWPTCIEVNQNDEVVWNNSQR